MNSYRFNGMAGNLARQAIVKGLKISWYHIYKIIRSIDNQGIIETHDGKKYVLELKEVTNEKAV